MTRITPALRAALLAVLVAGMIAPDRAGAQTIRGIVFDSALTQRPLGQAEVWSPTLGRTVVADAVGRFAFDSVTDAGALAAGDTIQLVIYHPLLERMGLPAPTIKIPRAAAGRGSLVVGTPSVATLRTTLCGAAADTDAVLVTGKVSTLAPSSVAPRVEVAWQELATTGTVIQRRTRTTPATVRGGSYWLCGAPVATPFAVLAEAGEAPPTIVRVAPTRERIIVRHVGVPAPGDSAQAVTGSWVIGGQVLSRQGDPIAGVEVAVGGTDRTARTGADGAFALSLDGPGRREFTVRAVGYDPTVISTYLSPAHRQLPAIVLEKTAQLLATRNVTARAPGVAGFEYRRRSGQGHYIDREQIEQRRAMSAAQLFTGIPGVMVQPSGTITFSRSEGQVGAMPGGCIPLYFVDGVPREIIVPMIRPILPPDLGPGQFISPEQIEAIEVYNSLGSIPAEYRKANAGCGVIVIWTRQGLELTEKRQR